eukprot:5427346-Amphidinium_carterae.1
MIQAGFVGGPESMSPGIMASAGTQAFVGATTILTSNFEFFTASANACKWAKVLPSVLFPANLWHRLPQKGGDGSKKIEDVILVCVGERQGTISGGMHTEEQSLAECGCNATHHVGRCFYSEP